MRPSVPRSTETPEKSHHVGCCYDDIVTKPVLFGDLLDHAGADKSAPASLASSAAVLRDDQTVFERPVRGKNNRATDLLIRDASHAEWYDAADHLVKLCFSVS